MPPVRNTHYVNVDDRSSNALHLGANQVIETKLPMQMQPQQSPNMVTSLPPAKQCNQYGSPSVHPSGSQQPIQQTPLTKAELRKVNIRHSQILLEYSMEVNCVEWNLAIRLLHAFCNTSHSMEFILEQLKLIIRCQHFSIREPLCDNEESGCNLNQAIQRKRVIDRRKVVELIMRTRLNRWPVLR